MVSVIIVVGQEEVQKNNWFVFIVVVDDGGYLLVLSCMDDCVSIVVYIFQEKVCIVVLGCCEIKGYEEMVNNGRIVFVIVSLLTLLEGGVLVVVDG